MRKRRGKKVGLALMMAGCLLATAAGGSMTAFASETDAASDNGETASDDDTIVLRICNWELPV